MSHLEASGPSPWMKMFQNARVWVRRELSNTTALVV